MAGHRFVVSGDPVMARDTVYAVLQSHGYTVTPTGDWTAASERGSKSASIVGGALAGKQGRHVKLDVVCQQDPQSNLVITLTEGTSGMSGGLIGMNQAKQVYAEVYTAIGSTFQGAGVLIQGGNL